LDLTVYCATVLSLSGDVLNFIVFSRRLFDLAAAVKQNGKMRKRNTDEDEKKA